MVCCLWQTADLRAWVCLEEVYLLGKHSTSISEDINIVTVNYTSVTSSVFTEYFLIQEIAKKVLKTTHLS